MQRNSLLGAHNANAPAAAAAAAAAAAGATSGAAPGRSYNMPHQQHVHGGGPGGAPGQPQQGGSFESYLRAAVEGDDGDEDFIKAAYDLGSVLQYRDTYKSIDAGQFEEAPPAGAPPVGDMDEKLLMYDRGVFYVEGLKTTPDKLVSWPTYIANMNKIFTLLEVGPWLSVARTRLQVMEEKFDLYSLLNTDLEAQSDRQRKGGGVYSSAMKVDNNVSLQTLVTAKELLDFIEVEAQNKTEPAWTNDEGHSKTLPELLQDLGVDEASHLTVEGLGLHPPRRKQFHRFDILDPELNRGGHRAAQVLQIFLRFQGEKFGNGFLKDNGGHYFGKLVHRVMERREWETTAPVATEYKIPITGHTYDEWANVARWVSENNLSFRRNRWVIQIQRFSGKRKDMSHVTNRDQLQCIFEPLFKATLNPSGNRLIANLLNHIGSFTLLSDENARRKNFHRDPKHPEEIPWETEPDDYWFMYYMWCNIATLNALRKHKGKKDPITFRPTCSPTTPHWDQLVSSVLLADSVNHGTKLVESWVMQYFFLFSRIGIIMSPLSNNGMSTPFFENPFKNFFRRGLNVALATDDPLHYHHTTGEPLVEEYSTTKNMYNLSPTDMSEIARNSVLISSFEEDVKKDWIGCLDRWKTDQDKSCVCDHRLDFRYDCLRYEQRLLNYILTEHTKKKPNEELTISTFYEIPSNRGGQTNAELENEAFIDKRFPYARIAVGASMHDSQRFHRAALSLCDALQMRQKYYAAVDEERMHSAAAAAATAAAKERRDLRVSDQLTSTLSGAALSGNSGDDLDMTTSVISHQQSFGSPAGTPAGRSPSGRIARPRTPRRAARAAQHTTANVTAQEERQWSYDMYYGVCLIARTGTAPAWPSYIPSIQVFIKDIQNLRSIVEDPTIIMLAHQRLQLLERKFGLHLAMNIGREAGVLKEKDLNNRDFYTAHKVDNNVHTDAGMNARVLHQFFVEKVKFNGHDVVMETLNKEPVTLKELVVDDMGIDPKRITVEELTSLFQNNRRLRSLFLSSDNYMGGRYFAELAKMILQNYKLDECTFAENRLEITGKSKAEWNELALWFDRYGMASKHNRWMIRIPRNYRQLRKDNEVSDFGEWLDNIFSPLWEVSLNPGKQMKTHHLLSNVSGFDCIGDEQKVDLPLETKAPHEWTEDHNPPYNYYMYYLWANIVSLNEFRHTKGLAPFTFRPQCGEGGAVNHLLGGFLLAKTISHGVTLTNYPVLEYLFYVAQLGISMSPLSNTSATVAYLENPFPNFFRRGLNVSLSTNEPLHYHFTSEPLIEEYSLGAKVWQLSANDLSEIARNSVLQSGFPEEWKREALGRLHYLHSTLGNDVRHSRVSDVRVAYRFETYHTELNFLDSILAAGSASGGGGAVGLTPASVTAASAAAQGLLSGGARTGTSGSRQGSYLSRVSVVDPDGNSIDPGAPAAGASIGAAGAAGGPSVGSPTSPNVSGPEDKVLSRVPRAMQMPQEECREYERVTERPAPAFFPADTGDAMSVAGGLGNNNTQSAFERLRARISELQRDITEQRKEVHDKVREGAKYAIQIKFWREQGSRVTGNLKEVDAGFTGIDQLDPN